MQLENIALLAQVYLKVESFPGMTRCIKFGEFGGIVFIDLA